MNNPSKIFILLLIISLCSCSPEKKSDEGNETAVIVSNYYKLRKLEKETSYGSSEISLRELINSMSKDDSDFVKRNTWRITEVKVANSANEKESKNVFIIKNDFNQNILMKDSGLLVTENHKGTNKLPSPSDNTPLEDEGK